MFLVSLVLLCFGALDGEIKRARGRALSLNSRPLAVANPMLSGGDTNQPGFELQNLFELFFQFILQVERIQTLITLSQSSTLFCESAFLVRTTES